MAKDHAPVGYTCSTIDNIIRSLEDVRSDNTELRDWGNDLHEQMEDMCDERDKWQTKAEDLETQLEYAHDEIKELKESLQKIDSVD